MSFLRISCFCMLLLLINNCDCKGELQTLDETTWKDMLIGEWMVEFYAPWCPACQQLEPLWKEFAKWSDDLGIKVGSVDVTLNAGLSGRFMITALPTIFHVKDGIFRQYRGARDKESFFSFVEEKKWQSVDPISSWKSPQSLSMSTVAYFFKLSMFIRSFHNSLVQDYGVPYWGSYILFGLCTILLGTLLGLVIVCILDCVTRARSGNANSHQPLYEQKNSEEEDVNEFEGEDVIKEDLPEGQKPRKRIFAAE